MYTTRIQKERFTDEMNESFQGLSDDFMVNRDFLDQRCSQSTIVMHPLPRDSRPGANDLNVDLNAWLDENLSRKYLSLTFWLLPVLASVHHDVHFIDSMRPGRLRKAL